MRHSPRHTVGCFLVLGVVFLMNSLIFNNVNMLKFTPLLNFRSLMTFKTIGMLMCGLMINY